MIEKRTWGLRGEETTQEPKSEDMVLPRTAKLSPTDLSHDVEMSVIKTANGIVIHGKDREDSRLRSLLANNFNIIVLSGFHGWLLGEVVTDLI